MTEIFLTDRAVERLESLDSETEERIKKKLKSITDFPEHYQKPLKGREDYRLRIGDYRALIDWEREEDTLYVKSVGHRRNFYDREF